MGNELSSIKESLLKSDKSFIKSLQNDSIQESLIKESRDFKTENEGIQESLFCEEGNKKSKHASLKSVLGNSSKKSKQFKSVKKITFDFPQSVFKPEFKIPQKTEIILSEKKINDQSKKNIVSNFEEQNTKNQQFAKIKVQDNFYTAEQKEYDFINFRDVILENQNILKLELMDFISEEFQKQKIETNYLVEKQAELTENKIKNVLFDKILSFEKNINQNLKSENNNLSEKSCRMVGQILSNIDFHAKNNKVPVQYPEHNKSMPKKLPKISERIDDFFNRNDFIKNLGTIEIEKSNYHKIENADVILNILEEHVFSFLLDDCLNILKL